MTRSTPQRTALITGGASGIGRAFGNALAARDMHVALVDRQLELAETEAEDIRSRGFSASAHALDVRDREAFAALAKELHQTHGRIDYLFNNAGIGVGGPMADFSPADWDDVLDVNVRGVVHGVEAVYPLMITQGFGHIINTASIAGLMPMALEGSYTASKHAVVGLSKSLRVEGRRHGVKVTVLCPGVIDTPILHGGAFGRIEIPGLTADKLEEIWQRLGPMDPKEFAKQALGKIFAGEFVVIVPRWWRAVWFLDRVAPNLSLKVWMFAYDRLRATFEDG